MKTLIAAVDLGSFVVKGALVEKNEAGEIKVLAHESEKSKGIKKGVVNNIDETAYIIKNLILKLQNTANQIFQEKEEKINIQKIHVGLGGKSLKTHTNRTYRTINDVIGEDLTKKLYEENLRLKIDGRDILDVITQEYFVDDEIEQNPVGVFCSQRIEGNYALVSGESKLKQNLEAAVKRIGILQDVEFHISPKVTAEALLTSEDKQLGCLLIDFGAETTTFSAFTDGYLRQVGVIPFGGKNISSDICEMKGILPEKAELLKRKYGCAMASLVASSRLTITVPVTKGMEERTVTEVFLASLIESRISEILDFVFAEVQKRENLNRFGSGIVITGGGALLRGLPELITYKTGLDVRFGEIQIPLNDENAVFWKPAWSQLTGLIKVANTTCCFLEKENEKQKEVQEEKTSNKTKGMSKNKVLSKMTTIFSGLFDESDYQKM